MSGFEYMTLVFGGVASFAYYCGVSYSEMFVLDTADKVLVHQVANIAVSLLAWWLLGWGIAFGVDSNYFAGASGFANVASNQYPAFFFIFALGSISSAIVAKSYANIFYMPFSIFVSGFFVAFVYSVIVHWVWSDAGWASPHRSSVQDYLLVGCGAVDTGGSGTIHLTAGMASLALLVTQSKWPLSLALESTRDVSFVLVTDKGKSYNGKLTVFRYLTTFLSLAGFCGVHAMSNLPISEDAVSLAGKRCIMTIIAAGTSATTSYLLSVYLQRHPCTKARKPGKPQPLQVFESINGALIAIAAGCSSCEFEGAFVIGLLSACIHVATKTYLKRSIFNQVSSLIASHVLCPIFGIVAVGFLASPGSYSLTFTEHYYDGSSRANYCAGVFYGGSGSLLAANLCYALSICSWVTILIVPWMLIGRLFTDANHIAIEGANGSATKKLNARSAIGIDNNDNHHLNSGNSRSLFRKSDPGGRSGHVPLYEPPLVDYDQQDIKAVDVTKQIQDIDFFTSSMANWREDLLMHSTGNGGQNKPGDYIPHGHFDASLCGYSWDLCAVFPNVVKGKPKASLNEEMVAFKEFVETLRHCHFETQQYYSVQNDEIICRIRMSLDYISHHAQAMSYPMLLDEEQIRELSKKGHEYKDKDGRTQRIKEFEIKDGIEDGFTTLKAYEFIYAKYSDAHKKLFAREDPRLKHPFTVVHRLKIMEAVIKGSGGNKCSINIDLQLEKGHMLAFYPLHSKEDQMSLIESWTKDSFNIFPWNTPVDEIRTYFGERAAFYFKFIAHYTTWLLSSSIAGLLVTLHLIILLSTNNGDIISAIRQMYSIPVYCFFISVWTQLMLENWKQAQNVQALKWGVSDFEANEDLRPEFEGTFDFSIIDGSPQKIFSKIEKNRRFRFVLLVITLKILFVISCFCAVFYFKYYATHISKNAWLNAYGATTGDVINAIQIQAMSTLYNKLSEFLTGYENNRTDTEFEDSLITKLFFFEFINSYFPAFYIAFVKGAIGDECIQGSCFFELGKLMLTFFVTNFVTANIVSPLISKLQLYYRTRQETGSFSVPENDKSKLSLAEQEYILKPSASLTDLINDYNEISIQFGFMTLFIAASPFIPIISLVNTALEIKNDGHRMLAEQRRCFPCGAQDIGTWYEIFETISVIAVFTNCGLVFYTMDLFEGVDAVTQLWSAFAFVVASFFVRRIVAYLVPDVPAEVDIQRRRQAFIVDKLIDNVPDEPEGTNTVNDASAADIDVKQHCPDDPEAPLMGGS